MSDNAPGAPRAAVIGTGRSGTGYAARLITEASRRTSCTHEGWWRAIGDPQGGQDVDASWLALPDIETGAWSGPVVHLVRDPVATVESLLRTEFFGAIVDTPYPQFALAHCPAAEEKLAVEGAVAAAVQFWASWNVRCAAVAQLTVRLEDLSDFEGGADSVGAATLDMVGDVLGAEFGTWQIPAAIPRDVNHRDHPVSNDLVIAVDEAYVWDRLGPWAAQFGYVRPGLFERGSRL
jgi:hypothetical protein